MLSATYWLDHEDMMAKVFVYIPVPESIGKQLVTSIEANIDTTEMTNQGALTATSGHVTLLFVGTDLDDKQVETVLKKCKALGKRTTQFEVHLRGTGLFTISGSDGHILYAAVESWEPMSLHKDLTKAIPFAEHAMQYVPHVTLAHLGPFVVAHVNVSYKWVVTDIIVSIDDRKVPISLSGSRIRL